LGVGERGPVASFGALVGRLADGTGVAETSDESSSENVPVEVAGTPVLEA
jgi:hypothetical protein